MGVPIDAPRAVLVEIRQFDQPLSKNEIVGEHDPRHGSQEHAVPAQHGQELARAVEELPGLHDEREARHQEHPPADGEEAREQRGQVDPRRHAVVGHDHPQLGDAERDGREGHGRAGPRRVVVVLLQGAEQVVGGPEERPFLLGEDLRRAGRADDADEGHDDGPHGDHDQLRQDLVLGLPRVPRVVGLHEDVHADGTDVRADAQGHHPPEVAAFGLRDARESADVVHERARPLGLGREPDEADEDGRDDDDAGYQKGDLVLFGLDPHEREVADCEDDEAREVARGHGPVGQGGVDLGERRPYRGEEDPDALSAPVDLGREPDAGQEDPLDDDEPESSRAPGAALDDREPDVPFGARGSARDAQETDEYVSNDDRQHRLPDIEPQGDQRGPGGPAADVERTGDDPESHKLPGTVCPSVWLKRPDVVVDSLFKRPFIVVLDFEALEDVLHGRHLVFSSLTDTPDFEIDETGWDNSTPSIQGPRRGFVSSR